MQSQLPAPQTDKPFSEMFWEAVRQAVPQWYEGLLQEYSPKTYSAFKAVREIEPYLLPQDKPILDAFIGFSTIVGAADIGIGVARSVRLSNPPFTKPRKKN